MKLKSILLSALFIGAPALQSLGEIGSAEPKSMSAAHIQFITDCFIAFENDPLLAIVHKSYTADNILDMNLFFAQIEDSQAAHYKARIHLLLIRDSGEELLNAFRELLINNEDQEHCVITAKETIAKTEVHLQKIYEVIAAFPKPIIHHVPFQHVPFPKPAQQPSIWNQPINWTPAPTPAPRNIFTPAPAPMPVAAPQPVHMEPDWVNLFNNSI